MSFATCSISSINELSDECEGRRSNEKVEGGDEYESKPMVSLPETSTAYKTDQWLFYVHSTAKQDEQNILTLKLVLVFEMQGFI